MKINAEAQLEYCLGKSIARWESLNLYVKFKEKGKLFKTKLHQQLTSTYFVVNAHLVEEDDRYESYDEYYEHVEEIVNNKELLKELAEDMIKKYFEKNHKNLTKKNKKKEVMNKVNKTEKIEVIVEIK